MVIIDTSVWIDYLRGLVTPQTSWLDTRIDLQRLALTDLIFCEVLQGVSNEIQAAQVEDQLRKLIIFGTGGVPLAAAAARNYRALRSHGRTTRKVVDCLIATYCLIHDHSLLHNDRDFDAFEKFLGLKVIHP